MSNAAEAAAWMLRELERDEVLEQEVAASTIAELFGDDLVYINEEGGLSIRRDVLREFRRLTGRPRRLVSKRIALALTRTR